MRVREIVLDGFKSYAKRTVITDWDPQFNCITGLNGSGKSNVLDAICFVLGITSLNTVRASNQQDLIYKRGQAGVAKASVSIVFDNSDKRSSPPDYRNCDTVTVTRQVVVGGTSKYLVNGHRAQQSHVQQLFQAVHLNVNNPNFLIMQGQITKVVNMKPREILGLIEEAAGTGMYEKERVKTLKEITNLEGPMRHTQLMLLEEIQPQLEALRQAKREYLEYQQLAASVERSERAAVATEWSTLELGLRDAEAAESSREAQLEELSHCIKTHEAELEALQIRVDELRASLGDQDTAAQLYQRIQDLNESRARLQVDTEGVQTRLTSAQERAIAGAAGLENAKSDLDKFNSDSGEFQIEYDQIHGARTTATSRVQEYRELLRGLETGYL